MQAVLAHMPLPPRTRIDSLPPRKTIERQLFRLSFASILNAYDYGHLGEAAALRLIAREIRRCLI
jgi:hypothetical protein